MLISYVGTGTLDNPIMVNSFGDEQYAGCTGFPADSHWVVWLVVCLHFLSFLPSLTYHVHPLPPTIPVKPRQLIPGFTRSQMSRERPVGRCPQCGNVLKMNYVGPPDDPHAHDEHDEHKWVEPKTFADYVRPEYR